LGVGSGWRLGVGSWELTKARSAADDRRLCAAMSFVRESTALYDRVGLLVPADRRSRERLSALPRKPAGHGAADRDVLRASRHAADPGRRHHLGPGRKPPNGCPPTGMRSRSASRLSASWSAHLCSRLSGREEPLGYPDVRRSRRAASSWCSWSSGTSPSRNCRRGSARRWRASPPRRTITAGSPVIRFVVYYGEVNEDSDGPAEACMPIAPSSESSAELPDSVSTHALRFEPAHREAYVRLRKAQVAVSPDPERLRRRRAVGGREQRRDHRRAA
jgi:hypothetical protein